MFLKLFFLVGLLPHTLLLQQLQVLQHLSLLNQVEILDLHILLSIRRPALDTRNSPDITPTSESPIFTLREFINVEILAGMTILVKS